MSSFFVGQRVRIKYWRVRGTASDQGVICEVGPWKAGQFVLRVGYLREDADCLVEADFGGIGAPLFDQLEPILPDGHRAAEETLEDLLPFLKEQKVSA